MRFARRTPPRPVPTDWNHTFSALRDADAWLASTREDTLQRQLALAAVPAPTGHEAPRAALMARMLTTLTRMPATLDAAGNVVLRIAPSRIAPSRIAPSRIAPSRDSAHSRDDAPVVVLAHLDTVFDDPELPSAQRDGARVVLPGIGDNGRGLAAMTTMAQALTRPDVSALLQRPVELVATVGEEGAGNLRGARHYFANRDAASPLTAASAVIALDGPGDTHVVHYGIASRRLRIVFRGPGGHPWADRHHPNAVNALGEAVARLARLSGQLSRDTTVTVTRVHGGESLTSIPQHASLDVDVRGMNAQAISTLEASVRRVADEAARAASRSSMPLHVAFERLGDRPGGTLAVDHPLVALAGAASTWHGTIAESASASTDANVPLSLDIPAIAIGAGGRGGDAHTRHEWYDDNDSARGVSRALAIVVGATTLR